MAHNNFLFLKFVAVGVASFILGSGASFLFAQVRGWDNPTAAPPGGNVAAPLNVGPLEQTRIGPLKLNGLLTLQERWRIGKDSAGGLYVSTGAEGQAPQRWMENYTVIGAVPSNPAAKLVVNGTVQILGGDPAVGRVLTAGDNGVARWEPALPAPSVNGHVLTAEGGKWVWKALPPTVSEVVSGSSNVSITSAGPGRVSISVERPYIPDVREVPYPPGGGKILYSNSEGSMSWGDPPKVEVQAKSGQTCGGWKVTARGVSDVWGCAVMKSNRQEAECPVGSRRVSGGPTGTGDYRTQAVTEYTCVWE
jgi:hypothetical protein